MTGHNQYHAAGVLASARRCSDAAPVAIHNNWVHNTKHMMPSANPAVNNALQCCQERPSYGRWQYAKKIWRSLFAYVVREIGVWKRHTYCSNSLPYRELAYKFVMVV